MLELSTADLAYAHLSFNSFCPSRADTNKGFTAVQYGYYSKDHKCCGTALASFVTGKK